jgi:hypothetical protein
MSGFYLASKEARMQPLPIPETTVIEQGEIIDFTPGTGVVVMGAAGEDFDGPAAGVAVNAHASGDGSSIKVITDPNAVFAHKSSNIITATGGSTTTFVVAGLLPQTDDIWKGGMLEVVTCAADPSMVGKRIPITDSTGSSGTLTFATQPSAFAAGDTARLCPGPFAINEHGWDLDSDGMNVDWDTSGGEGLQLVDTDPANMTSFWKIRLHRFGNDGATIS